MNKYYIIYKHVPSSLCLNSYLSSHNDQQCHKNWHTKEQAEIWNDSSLIAKYIQIYFYINDLG